MLADRQEQVSKTTILLQAIYFKVRLVKSLQRFRMI